MLPECWGSSVVVINGPAITVDMFGNVVKGKINVDNISRAHITNTLYTNTCAPTPASSGAMRTHWSWQSWH